MIIFAVTFRKNLRKTNQHRSEEVELSNMQSNLLQLRKRYLHIKVVKSFVDGVTGEVKPYSGHVEQVSWDSSEGCYMFHVRYEDDGDEEDMEHWELKKYV